MLLYCFVALIPRMGHSHNDNNQAPNDKQIQNLNDQNLPVFRIWGIVIWI